MMIAFVIPYMLAAACCEETAPRLRGGGTESSGFALQHLLISGYMDELSDDQQDLCKNGACL